MEDHRVVYREEAFELLTDLEEALIELEQNPDDSELVNRIFRSMHTIKGSGFMFGFDNVAAFTHEVETAFDMVRSQKIEISKSLIELTLSSCDFIRRLIDGDDVEESVERALVMSFQEILYPVPPAGSEEKNWGGRKFELPARPVIPLEAASEESGRSFIPARRSGDIEHLYRIRFLPHRDFFLLDNNPLVLLEELRKMGAAEILCHSKNIPVLLHLDTEGCYLYWDILLTTTNSEEDIRDVFIFAEDLCELTIHLIHKEIKNGPPPALKRIGEILVERGDISPEIIYSALERQPRVGEVLLASQAVDSDTLESALMEQEKVREASQRHQLLASSSRIRVSAEKLDALMGLAGELATVQARLGRKAAMEKDAELDAVSEELERLAAALREQIMNIRMLPVGSAFRKFKRLIYDLSNDLGKEVEVEISGEETELDKNILEQLNAPLMHIIRNALDHDIESPEERASAGKPARGKIRMTAGYSGADVLVTISGDGRGMDTAAIRRKAVELRIIEPDENLGQTEIRNLIFTPGFSTAKTISGVSGRGVGMDVVRQSIEKLRGTVEIESEPGKGASVTLRLPLTLAIADGLLVRVGEGNYIMPLTAVEECVELTREQADQAERRQEMPYRGRIMPYLSLRTKFRFNQGRAPDIEKVVVVRSGRTLAGLGVDMLVGQHQAVIRSLGKFYRDVKIMSGATILGDGTVALILDVHRLVQLMENGEE